MEGGKHPYADQLRPPGPHLFAHSADRSLPSAEPTYIEHGWVHAGSRSPTWSRTQGRWSTSQWSPDTGSYCEIGAGRRVTVSAETSMRVLRSRSWFQAASVPPGSVSLYPLG